jgi:ankyrin repeat protein
MLCISFVPSGHREAIRLLLSKGVPVDPLNRCGTPLHLAALKGHDQAVKILLEHGADVSVSTVVVLFHYISIRASKML